MENFETYRLDQTGQQTQAILDQVSTNTADIAQLRALYEALTQSEPVIIQPSDTWPVADPEENVIYRVIDRVNTPPQSYSDYMWNGTAMVLMATYNNSIDDVPTPGSNNLVKSGGVAASIVFDISAYHATGSTLATYSNLAAALGADGVNVPASVRKGGMSVKFVQSSDNKYVQYRLLSDTWTINTDYWAIADEGVYVENPEFVYIKTDKDDKILLAIKTDGSIYFGAGVPQQVVDYINEKLAELSLDEYEDIVAFLDGLEKGDKSLQALLNEKVDKEEGKSLIDSEYASTKSTIDTPEFLEVTTDSEDRVLEGITSEGVKRANLPIDTPSATVEHIENPEWLSAITDKNNKLLSSRFKDGTLKEHVGISTPKAQVGKYNVEETIDAIKDSISVIDTVNQQEIIYKSILSRANENEYFDVSNLGLFFYIHVSNYSEYACELPMNFYNDSKVYQGIASVYYRGISEYYGENVKYGRVYLKAGEEATILISNENHYKYLGVLTANIPEGTAISFNVCSKSYGQHLEKTAVTIPYLGGGKLYIQPMNYNYSHCSRITTLDKYLIVCFSGSQRNYQADADFPLYGQYQTMAIIERGNYNNIVYKIFDGHPNDSGLYVYGNANNRICPKDHDLYILYYAYDNNQNPVSYYIKKFDVLSFEFSTPQKALLSYDNISVEWNKRNELEMLNTLYGTELDVNAWGVTQISDMRYYDGYFYTIIGGSGEPTAHGNYPWNILKSVDAITWEPVACIEPNGKSAELVFDIVNGIILIQIRSNGYAGYVDYNGYMVCDIQGNVLKAPTFLSDVDSKGSVFVKENNLYIVYNIRSSDAHYFKRNKIAIAKLNEDYSLTTLKTYTDMNGLQYFDFTCKNNVVYMSNTEDPRGYSYDDGYGPYGGGVSVAIVNDAIFQNDN